MTDLTLTTTGGATHVQANTGAGEDFVDQWAGEILTALDVDRISIPRADAGRLVEYARECGLTSEQVTA